MAIVFEEYHEKHIEAVRAMNARVAGLLAEDMRLPEHPRLEWLPKGAHPQLYQEAFLAVEAGAVRGGYALKHQEFLVNGAACQVATYRVPISIGIVDRAYASLGMMMLRDALARQPLLFSLGMGGMDQPLARMQKALGWQQYTVPFYYKPVDGGRFVRNLQALRRSPARRALLDMGAWSGAAALGVALWRRLRPARVPADTTVDELRDFGDWADELWMRTKAKYALIAVRDRDAAGALYPVSGGRFLSWKIGRGGRVRGWVVCLDTQMRGHKQFGNMRLGTIVDGLADPEDAGLVMAAAARELERRGVDLTISNQAHASWGAGLRAAGFLEGPSNFVFSVSKQLGAGIAPFATRVREAHINRGDGDGPIHL